MEWILLFGAAYFLFSLIQSIHRHLKTGSWRTPNTPKQMRKYLKEKLAIEKNHCGGLPKHDSRGIFSLSGSFADKTGRFSPQFQKDMDELNKKYGYGSTDN